MSHYTGKVAVVTGAGSGIGRHLAIQLGQAGARLALSDINRAGLDETLGLLPKACEARGSTLDVSSREAVCAEISTWLAAQPGWTVLGVTESPITGPKGNKEFLIAARRDG